MTEESVFAYYNISSHTSDIWETFLHTVMKKCSEAMQTLRTGCSKAHPQTNKHTNRQGGLQYTAQLSVQCNQIEEEEDFA